MRALFRKDSKTRFVQFHSNLKLPPVLYQKTCSTTTRFNLFLSTFRSGSRVKGAVVAGGAAAGRGHLGRGQRGRDAYGRARLRRLSGENWLAHVTRCPFCTEIFDVNRFADNLKIPILSFKCFDSTAFQFLLAFVQVRNHYQQKIYPFTFWD
jgi:hypothetical protein